MDANKRKALIEISYEIKACGTCAFADIEPNQDWGTCDLHTYKHEKHTTSVRQLSINRHGVCTEYSTDVMEKERLGGFKEFLT